MIPIACALGVMLVALGGCYGWRGVVQVINYPFHGVAFVVFAVLLQAAAMFLPETRLFAVASTSACLAAFCFANRQLAGIWLAGAGIALNMLVMLANGGAMPLDPQRLSQAVGYTVPADTTLAATKDALISDSQAQLAWLGDRFQLPGPLANLAIWSIGDFVLIAGVALLLIHVMKGTSASCTPTHPLAAFPATRSSND